MLVMVNKITKLTDRKIKAVNGKHMMYNIFNIYFNLPAQAGIKLISSIRSWALKEMV